MIEKIENNEIVLLEILRLYYNFLIKIGYQIKTLIINELRDGDTIFFINQTAKLEICFVWKDGTYTIRLMNPNGVVGTLSLDDINQLLRGSSKEFYGKNGWLLYK